MVRMFKLFSRYPALLRTLLTILDTKCWRSDQREDGQEAEHGQEQPRATLGQLPLHTTGSASDLTCPPERYGGPALLHDKRRTHPLIRGRRKSLMGKRILIAEDDPINARLIQCMIHRAGCKSMLASTGKAAVDAARASLGGTGPTIDLILMDVHLPDLDGLAAARQIRRLSDELASCGQLTMRRPPLIAITANAFAEDRRACLEAGMDDYLAKPFSWIEFQALLVRWLSDGRRNGKGSERNVRAA